MNQIIKLNKMNNKINNNSKFWNPEVKILINNFVLNNLVSMIIIALNNNNQFHRMRLMIP